MHQSLQRELPRDLAILQTNLHCQKANRIAIRADNCQNLVFLEELVFFRILINSPLLLFESASLISMPKLIRVPQVNFIGIEVDTVFKFGQFFF